ncbi:AIPR family protein [Roseimaritima ulvae]|uniref:AIPR protein n=1 Tax=Roseimaritima ulvae TaxID=980254 RepID=A0A5B9QUQ1_9BACT|nr:AIPR family protein [Roseimaritima ulvae]QEG42744.1 AIPR protein [Roseimaritima ulvae]
MAKNDVVLLDSIVEKCRPQFGAELDDGELFELFSFDQILKDYEPSFEDLEAGWTDGGNDGGLDGFFIYIDDQIATGDSVHLASKRQPEIDVHVLSVKRAAKFQQQPIDTLISSLAELLDLSIDNDNLSYPYNSDVISQRDLFTSNYVALADRQPSLNITVHYCSRGDASNIATNLRGRADTLIETLEGLFSHSTLRFRFVGATELLESARKQRDFTLRLPFTESYISREGQNYILLCPLSGYNKFICDGDGNLRRYLFESNVRAYLGDVQINRDIQETLNRGPGLGNGDFWWLNNGITILGTKASVAGKELCVENVQIVNGLQTTETIYRYFQGSVTEINDERAVLVKIILAADPETRARIVKATNYQNTVELASLRGLDKIQRDIEQFLFDRGWFYDRRKNVYKNEGRPAERIISVSYLAGAVRAIALGDPAKSSRQRSKSLRDDETYHKTFNTNWDLDVFLSSLEIIRAVESVMHSRRKQLDSPPSTFVHYVGFAYTCEQLGKFPYQPEDTVGIAVPNAEDVQRIRNELEEASEEFQGPGRKYAGVKLSKSFIDEFVKNKFATAQDA